jgi:hypothetical protein
VTVEEGTGAAGVWRWDLKEGPVEELPIQVVSRKKPVFPLPMGKSDPKQSADQYAPYLVDETKNHVSFEIVPYAIVTLLIEFE